MASSKKPGRGRPKKKKRSRRDAADLSGFVAACTVLTLHVHLASMAPTPFEHHQALEELRDLIEQVEAGYETALSILEKELSSNCDLCGAKLPEVGVCSCSSLFEPAKKG